MAKTIEMTGSPKPYFATKEKFFKALEPYGYMKSKIKKINNSVDILVTNDIDSNTNKMKLAKKLAIEIMTYEEFVELFDLEN